MKTLKRLTYLIIIIISVYICLELAKNFTEKLDHWFHDSLENPNDIFSKPENIESFEIFSPTEIGANNVPDVIFNRDYLRWQPANPCAKLPTYRDIKTNNIYWQVLTLPQNSSTLQSKQTSLYSQEKLQKSEDYYLFGAYYDSRGPDVKILGMTRGKPRDLYCNIWFDKGIEPKITKTTYHYVWNQNWKWKPYLLNPYLFSCDLAGNSAIPKAVSLTSGKCDTATNLLKVNHNFDDDYSSEKYDFGRFGDFEAEVEGKSKDFMVCVKGLDFTEDISYKLIEWIELIRLLGADKIHFYILHIHQNVAKVLEHYKQVGWILMEGLSFPETWNSTNPVPIKNTGFLSNNFAKNRPQTKRYELIPYNDCFYKHREEYKYVILLDIDEIIMPQFGNWKDLLSKMHKTYPENPTSTFSLVNSYFFDDIARNKYEMDKLDYPETIGGRGHMLRTLHRTRNVTQPSVFVKGFHNASDVVALHNHFPIECAHRRRCAEVRLDEGAARLAHYRGCPQLLGERRCDALRKDYVRDDGILRFREELLRNMRRTIEEIGL